jgi:two-component system sensor histidine kinase UhpB
MYLRIKEARLDDECSTYLFRIFQEALTNVARHAKATGVSVTLKNGSGNLVLEVEGNGRGISDDEISNPRSLGLRGMHDRAFLCGGEMKITGIAGQ